MAAQDRPPQVLAPMEKFEQKLRQLFPSSRGRTDRTVRLADLAGEDQAEAIRLYGLPADVARVAANVIFLGGKPYCNKDALSDLATRRGLLSIKTEPLPPIPCTDLGCSYSKTVGWKALGETHEEYRDALLLLRKRYPGVEDDELKSRIYKATEPEACKAWERTQYCRAIAVFKDEEGNEVTYSMIGDCCPHSATSVITSSSAYFRMAQTRGINIVLRAGAKLPLVSAEELSNVVVDQHGQVVGIKKEEDPAPQTTPPPLEVEFTEAGLAEAQRLVKALGWTKGQADDLVGRLRDEGKVLTALREKVAALSKGEPKAGPKEKADGKGGGWSI